MTLTISLLCFLLVFLLPSCSSSTAAATTNTTATNYDDHFNRCSALSCGDFHNIKCPFSLEGNPHNCSIPWKQLSCENNQTILYVSSKKFHVTHISYKNTMIRIIDPGLRIDNCSSMPMYSLTSYDLIDDDFFGLSTNSRAIVFMNCRKSAVVDYSPYFVDASPCIKASTSNMKSYVVVYPAKFWDLKKSCNVLLMSWMMSKKDKFDSFYNLHDEMMKGFNLYWSFSSGTQCRGSLLSLILDYLMMLRRPLVVMVIFLVMLFIGRCILSTPFVVALLIYALRRRHRAMDGDIEDFLYTYGRKMPTRFSYMGVKRMTNDFKEKLGEGGFGSVFKGFLRSNRPVAIKILGTAKGNGQDFINEVATIGRIHHVNVVQLIGFVAERSRRALIYEFMPNGSLDKYIFPREGRLNPLSWERTYEIAVGIARGIEYLHRGCDMRILHFDIKPHNILLDENYVPKISDFGLARLYSMDDSIVSITAARGTLGYIAPELFYKSIGGVSYKSDVYSFGMLLMEMAGRRKNVNPLAQDSSQIYFPSWIYDKLDSGADIEIEDATEHEKEMAKQMIIIASWCIQMKPTDRPSMTRVVEMLEETIGLLQMPPKPFFTIDLNDPANCTQSEEISSST